MLSCIFSKTDEIPAINYGNTCRCHTSCDSGTSDLLFKLHCKAVICAKLPEVQEELILATRRRGNNRKMPI